MLARRGDSSWLRPRRPDHKVENPKKSRKNPTSPPVQPSGETLSIPCVEDGRRHGFGKGEENERRSSRGTLVATAEGLVNASEAGYAVEELDAIVRVGTKDVLPKLAWEKRLRRTRIRNRNVYFSPKRSIREQQIASRRVWEAQPSVSKSIAAQDVLPDELKAAIILFFSLLDERERRVYAGLESLKLGYGGDRQMAEILGLDVSTVARGRRELLEHDVNVERVRKAGAGRKAVEKKRQKSSRRSKNL